MTDRAARDVLAGLLRLLKPRSTRQRSPRRDWSRSPGFGGGSDAVYVSIVEASVRSGRSVASPVVWALAWPLAMALGVTLVSLFGYMVGWSLLTPILGFFVPFAVGAIVGWRTPGLVALGSASSAW